MLGVILYSKISEIENFLIDICFEIYSDSASLASRERL
jgi:hypothetical protein